MKNQILEWGKNNLCDNSITLLTESIICYNVGAYKSAYLMSYLAFKQTIRERILNFDKCPDGFLTTDWEEVKNNLYDDEHWESKLNAYVEVNPNKSGSINIFKYQKKDNVRENILIKYKYWKNIRNCCAHAKEVHINSATVEQFWNYIQDDLCEFYVNGGKTYLVNELCEIYKYRTIDDYLKKLPNILTDIALIYKNNINDCFEEFFKIVKDRFRIMGKEDKGFWDKFIYNENENIKYYLVKNLMKDADIFVNFYGHYHEILTIAYEIDKVFIKEKLGEWLIYDRPCEDYEIKRYWELFCDILKRPPVFIDIDKITSRNEPRYVDKIIFTEEQIIILKSNDIFNKILYGSYSYIFKVDFDDIKKHAFDDETNAIMWFQYATWNKELISMFSYACKRLSERINYLTSSYYGSWERSRLTKYKETAKKHIIDLLWYYSESKEPLPDILLEMLTD